MFTASHAREACDPGPKHRISECGVEAGSAGRGRGVRAVSASEQGSRTGGQPTPKRCRRPRLLCESSPDLPATYVGRRVTANQLPEGWVENSWTYLVNQRPARKESDSLCTLSSVW